MKEISLVYYGDLSEIGQHMLYLLNVLKIYPATQKRSGFYALESSYGHESVKKLSLDLENIETEAVLIYRYLSNEELNIIKRGGLNIKYYILSHRLFDVDYIQREVIANISNAWIIADYTESSSVQNYIYLKKMFNTKNILKINSINKLTEKRNIENSFFRLPVVILFFVKILINPINELKRHYVLIKYSNLRMLSRLIELLLFFNYIICAIFIKTLKSVLIYTYYKTHFLNGFLKVLLIKIGYYLRHALLMMGFKSFGIFVDLYYVMVRIKDQAHVIYDKLVYYIYYRLFYFLYYNILKSIVVFLYYRVLYFLYYNILKSIVVFLYYRVLCFLYYNILKSIVVLLYYRVGYFIYYKMGYPLYYRTRHFMVMSLFKIYGLAYDLCTYSHRVTKLFLMYPFFKIYWFCKFQYLKRIKKNYLHDL